MMELRLDFDGITDGTTMALQMELRWQYDGASVLACAYQLKVWSENPKDFEYWFRKQLMSKIRNDFIKQHQLGRCRYLSLLAQSVGARFLACV